MTKRRSVYLLFLALPVLHFACGGTAGDSGGSHDMAEGTGPVTVVGLPTCQMASVTADTLYPVMQRNCVFNGCHNANGVPYGVSSAADMKTKLTSAAAETTRMPRVTPGDVDKSYLIYKLMGQQAKAAPADTAGRQMPLGSSMLTDVDLCQFVVWVKGGAN